MRSNWNVALHCRAKVMAGFVLPYDATAVARLKAAGGTLPGKLHTTELIWVMYRSGACQQE